MLFVLYFNLLFVNIRAELTSICGDMCEKDLLNLEIEINERKELSINNWGRYLRC